MRRRDGLKALGALAVAAAGGPLPGAAWAADGARLSGGRLTADFEPLGGTWLGYDAGHEAFTAELAAALQPHVPLRVMVRDDDAETAARALLVRRGLDVSSVTFVTDADAPYFVRDAAVFAHDGKGRPALVDFRWSYYGWSYWCTRRYGRGSRAARRCGTSDPASIDGLERRLADGLSAAVFRSTLAIEGGGVEVNGQGLLIANEELWTNRNPGQTRAALEAQMLRLPGIQRVVWVPQGLAHDPLHRATITGRYVAWGTGGHTDQFVRFADPRTVLLAWPEAAEVDRHPVAAMNLQRMRRAEAALQRATDAQGRPLRVVRVPLPVVVERRVTLDVQADTRFSRGWSPDAFARREKRVDGDWVTQVASTSWLNYVVANDVVLIPDYSAHGSPGPLQDRVQRLFEQVFPGRRVRTIDPIEANWVGGGAHCATLSEPAAA